MTKNPNRFKKSLWQDLKWCHAVGMIFCLAAMVGGCVAQQADVVRIKRELDAKIRQLDKSKTSLQQAVTDANVALEKANVLIARQRGEIQELLQTRAEVMDQVANIKDTDLSQVRGATEKNQHLVGELKEKFLVLETKIDGVNKQVQDSRSELEPLVQGLRTQITAEEQLRAEQGGKLGEFRTSLVDYQRVLTGLGKNVAQQEQKVMTLQQQVDRIGQRQDAQHQEMQAKVTDVQQYIKSVVGTFEKINATLSERLDTYEQQRAPTLHQIKKKSSYSPQISLTPVQRNTQPSFEPMKESSLRPNLPSKQAVSKATLAATSSSPSIATPLARTLSHPSSEETPQGEREAYLEALNLLRGKNFSGAAREFSGFLRTFPNSPLAANSQYWLGECYYGQRRFQEAIDEFERVFTFYSDSNKVPASLLKIGYSHLELRQPTMARSVFQQLVRAYPQSSAAIKAHGRLQEVNALLHNPS